MTKRCSRCKQDKPGEAFNKNARHRTGLQDWCRACQQARYREPDAQARAKAYRSNPATKARLRAYYARPEVRRRLNEQQRQREYGLPFGGTDLLLDTQDGACAVCRSPITHSSAHVDHDHSSGLVRGLLCFSCNVAIGHLRDDPALLRAAAAYLEAHTCLSPSRPQHCAASASRAARS